MWLTIAHRGDIDRQNTLEGALWGSNQADMVEIDVRYSTDRRVVLCHDRELRNDRTNCTLDAFLNGFFLLTPTGEVEKKALLMIDIKAFGMLEAQKLARSVAHIVKKFESNKQNVYLCSFNEYCVAELLCIRDLEPDCCGGWQIGVISAGIPLGMFGHLDDIDFVSLDYNCVCEDVVERLHADRGLRVFVWVVNDESMKRLMSGYRVDGIIQDFASAAS